VPGTENDLLESGVRGFLSGSMSEWLEVQLCRLEYTEGKIPDSDSVTTSASSS
jgi:hypothetical protein